MTPLIESGVRLGKYATLRLTNGGRQRQRDDEQRKDDTEGHIKSAKQGSNNGPTDAANPEAKIDNPIIFSQIIQAEELTDQDGNTVIVPPKLKATQAIAAKKVASFSGANNSAAIPTSETT